MACDRRRLTGDCQHHHCGYPDESGYDCVDVTFGSGQGFCEVGLGCVRRCGFSYRETLQDDALAAWAERYPDEVEATWAQIGEAELDDAAEEVACWHFDCAGCGKRFPARDLIHCGHGRRCEACLPCEQCAEPGRAELPRVGVLG